MAAVSADLSGLLGRNPRIAALREHTSQLGPWDPTEMITGWARMQGKPRRLPAAEAFRLMRLED